MKGHRVVFIGRAGGDPEMRYTPSGVAVTNVNLATTEKIAKTRNGDAVDCPEGWKDGYQGKSWELTTWFRVTAWRGAAEAINQYLKKGDQIYIEGRLKGEAANGTQNPRVWTANDGTPRASFEVTIEAFQFLGSGGSGRPEPRDEDLPPDIGDAGDDLAF